MRQAGERAAFLEEGFMPTRKVARSCSGMRGYDSPFARKASVEGRYSLDRDRRLIPIMSEVHEREAAGGEQANDAVVLEPRAYRNRLIDLPAWLWLGMPSLL